MLPERGLEIVSAFGGGTDLRELSREISRVRMTEATMQRCTSSLASEARIAGARHRLRSAADAKFAENRGDLIAHGLLADGQHFGDSAVVETLGEQFRHLLFAPGKGANKTSRAADDPPVLAGRNSVIASMKCCHAGSPSSST